MRIGKPVMMAITPHGPPNSKLYTKWGLGKNVIWGEKNIRFVVIEAFICRFSLFCDDEFWGLCCTSGPLTHGWINSHWNWRDWKRLKFKVTMSHVTKFFLSQNHHHRRPISFLVVLATGQYKWHLLFFTNSVQGRTSREWPSTALAYPSLIWSVKSYLPTIWVRPMTLTFISSMLPPNKASITFLSKLWCLPVLPTVEHKDDSQIIPRSSSVIVKRLPAARPGKGKASMYLAGTPQSLPSSEPVLRGSSINSGTTYHKGAMSKRFDGKDEQASLSKPPPNVSLFHIICI